MVKLNAGASERASVQYWTFYILLCYGSAGITCAGEDAKKAREVKADRVRDHLLCFFPSNSIIAFQHFKRSKRENRQEKWKQKKAPEHTVHCK